MSGTGRSPVLVHYVDVQIYAILAILHLLVRNLAHDREHVVFLVDRPVLTTHLSNDAFVADPIAQRVTALRIKRLEA